MGRAGHGNGTIILHIILSLGNQEAQERESFCLIYNNFKITLPSALSRHCLSSSYFVSYEVW